MTTLQLCIGLSTFALFAAATWRMLQTAFPDDSVACRCKWVLWGLLHLGVAVGALWWWMDNRTMPSSGEWHLCLLRTCVALIFCWPSRRPLATAP